MFDEQTQETIVVPEMEALILQRRRKANRFRKWDRPSRPELSPRQKRTDRIQVGCQSVTSPEEVPLNWEDIEGDNWDCEPSSVDAEEGDTDLDDAFG
jgi:hypothetical protein